MLLHKTVPDVNIVYASTHCTSLLLEALKLGSVPTTLIIEHNADKICIYYLYDYNCPVGTLLFSIYFTSIIEV